jgi:hypothetical protein
MTVEESIWKQLETKVDALVTRRLLAFHDALVERGQITDPPAPSAPEETGTAANHCTEDYSSQSSPAL